MIKALLIFTVLMIVAAIATGIIAPVEKGAIFGIAAPYNIIFGVFFSLFITGFFLIMLLIVSALKNSNAMPDEP